MPAPSKGDLESLILRWKQPRAVSSNPGDPEDDAFANGTDWGRMMAAHDLKQLLESYGE